MDERTNLPLRKRQKKRVKIDESRQDKRVF